jgi:hypothetical protein
MVSKAKDLSTLATIGLSYQLGFCESKNENHEAKMFKNKCIRKLFINLLTIFAKMVTMRAKQEFHL